MINNTSILKLVSVILLALVPMMSSPAVLASSGIRSGSLSVFGQVEVNGERAFSGGTLFSDSTITTGEQSGASISLGALGRVELSANSAARLSFEESILKGTIEKGRARISTSPGVSVRLATAQGIIQVDGSQATSFTVTVGPEQPEIEATSGTIELIAGAECSLIVAGKGESPGQAHQSRKSLIIWLAAMSGGAATAVWLMTRGSDPHNDMDFGGTVGGFSPGSR